MHGWGAERKNKRVQTRSVFQPEGPFGKGTPYKMSLGPNKEKMTLLMVLDHFLDFSIFHSIVETDKMLWGGERAGGSRKHHEPGIALGSPKEELC